jgi:hypothetical protein
MMNHFSLHVGINDYPGTGSDLHGCVNDAVGWADLCKTLGYNAEVLLDLAATKARVVESLESVVARARFGDRIVFTYSGHGSFVPDLDGDEADGRDECLVLYGFDLLTDDEMYAIFQKRRFGVRVYVFSDSCHSGTASRFATRAAGRPRFLHPSNFMDVPPTLQPKARNAPSRPGTAFISGCDDNEYSYDAYIDGRPCGAFSNVALRTWKPGIRLAAWHRAIREFPLPNGNYPQTPQLQASTWQRTWSL